MSWWVGIHSCSYSWWKPRVSFSPWIHKTDSLSPWLWALSPQGICLSGPCRLLGSPTCSVPDQELLPWSFGPFKGQICQAHFSEACLVYQNHTHTLGILANFLCPCTKLSSPSGHWVLYHNSKQMLFLPCCKTLVSCVVTHYFPYC